MSGSSGLGFGRQTNSTNFLNFQGVELFKDSREEIHSGIGEWNSILGSRMANNLIIGYTKQDESRKQLDTLFPFVDILENGVTYTSFGTEPFTPFNLLYYNTFQAQDSFTRSSASRTRSPSVARSKSPALITRSISAFRAPTCTTPSTTSTRRPQQHVNLRRFSRCGHWKTSLARRSRHTRSSMSRIPALYPARTCGVPATTSRSPAVSAWTWRSSGNTAYDNPAADALTFRSPDGGPIQFNTGALPDGFPAVVAAHRRQLGREQRSDKTYEIRGGTGVFTGKPAYVWISNQIGNTGMLTGFIREDNTTAYPFIPASNPDAYKPAATGEPPASTSLAVTNRNFKFPQTWRTNIAMDRELPLGEVHRRRGGTSTTVT